MIKYKEKGVKMMVLTPFFFIYCKILSPFRCLEDPRQIVVVFAFCHEFTMQPAGFGDGFQ